MTSDEFGVRSTVNQFFFFFLKKIATSIVGRAPRQRIIGGVPQQKNRTMSVESRLLFMLPGIVRYGINFYVEVFTQLTLVQAGFTGSRRRLIYMYPYVHLTRTHTATECHTQLAKMSFDEAFDLTAVLVYFQFW